MTQREQALAEQSIRIMIQAKRETVERIKEADGDQDIGAEIGKIITLEVLKS